MQELKTMWLVFFSCEWDGGPCDVSNFSTVITDYGLCYMFNSEDSLDLQKTGNMAPLESVRTGIALLLFTLININLILLPFGIIKTTSVTRNCFQMHMEIITSI